nr:dihydrofolate reductase family protein [Arthrobacter sp. H14]
MVVTGRNSPLERRRQFEQCADLIVCGENRIDIDILLKELAKRGHRQILCEGGPHLFGSFQQAGLVDELCLSLSPTLVAGQDMRIAVSTAGRGPSRTSQHLPRRHGVQSRYPNGLAACPCGRRHAFHALLCEQGENGLRR